MGSRKRSGKASRRRTRLLRLSTGYEIHHTVSAKESLTVANEIHPITIRILLGALNITCSLENRAPEVPPTLVIQQVEED